ncbi:MAG TPA: SRPBCC family protein [Ferruginibacter sp.]|nr:SRPBCC family protein [Ferruginibacter sp.]HMP20867.1 SRPBCC family protein [Ferruginibacter sp.]
MKFVKAFLFGATGLFIIITMFSLLIPFNVKVSRSVVINTNSTAKIIGQAANISNWHHWHPLFKSDSTTTYIINKTPGQQSAVVTNNNRQSTITFTAIDSASVQFSLASKGENDINNIISITPIEPDNTVQVTWQATTKLKWYPWQKFYGIFIDKLTSPGYEAALDGLKNYVEGN